MARSADLETWGKRVRCGRQRVREDGRDDVCMGHRHAGCRLKRAKLAEGGWNWKGRLRDDGCLERVDLVP
jgi:hypothetical protein